MCGIAGTMQTDGCKAIVADLRAMMDGMRHRGPDGEGFHTDGPIGIAMTRLAIIDVAGGTQPIFNEDRTIAIVCNGEIYNHTDLRRQLQSRGHRFRTGSDIEVILHLYEERGEECFAELNGMFGVAIADFRHNRLVLARDPFGQKSLYVWKRPGGIAFASELKAITKLPGFKPKPNSLAIANYLHFRYIPAPLSIFEDTFKVGPGSYIVYDSNGASRECRYFNIRFQSNGTGPHTDPARTREELMVSVDRHLMSERPLGIFLSGGVDSSAILACMHDLGHRDIRSYTVGFEGYEENEFTEARQIAQQFKTRHTEVCLSADSFWTTLDETVFSADEPMADLTAVPLYHLSKRASQDVVVVLSGEGADELLAGYTGCETLRETFDRMRYARKFRPIAKGMLRLPAPDMLPDMLKDKLTTLAGSDADYLARNPSSMGFVFDDDFRIRNFPTLAHHGSVLPPLSDYFKSRQNWNGVDLHLGGLIEWWLPDDLLLKADRMSMANSIELRCPFLDTGFASFCAQLPLDAKVQARSEEPVRKIALKSAFATVLPKGIVNLPKKGFSIPVYTWLVSRFAERARKELLRDDAFSSSLLSRTLRSQLLNQAIQGDSLSQRRVWSLIVLNKWADCYL